MDHQRRTRTSLPCYQESLKRLKRTITENQLFNHTLKKRAQNHNQIWVEQINFIRNGWSLKWRRERWVANKIIMFSYRAFEALLAIETCFYNKDTLTKQVSRRNSKEHGQSARGQIDTNRF